MPLKRLFLLVMVRYQSFAFRFLLTSPDWTEINVVERITKVVARVSSCMFGGTELSENEKWVEASIAFAIDGFHGAQKIKKFPHFLRPLAKHFIAEIRSIAAHYREAEKAAIPILKRREQTGEKALDLLYWMSDQAKGGECDLKFLAGILLKVRLGTAVGAGYHRGSNICFRLY